MTDSLDQYILTAKWRIMCYTRTPAERHLFPRRLKQIIDYTKASNNGFPMGKKALEINLHSIVEDILNDNVIKVFPNLSRF